MAANYPSSLPSFDSGGLHKTSGPTSQTTLDADITGLPATFTVTDGSDLPTANFAVYIDSESIFITSRTTNTLTVGARGHDGTATADHSSGATVTQVHPSVGIQNQNDEIVAIATAFGTGPINGLTADATPDSAADYVVTYDASAGALKKVLLDNLPGGVDTTGTPADNQIAIFTDADTIEGSSVLNWDGDDMGIGTATPGAATSSFDFSASRSVLHFKGSTTTALLLDGTNPEIIWNDNNGAANEKLLLAHISTADVLTFDSLTDSGSSRAANILAIDLGGRVGISRLPTTDKLEVAGNIQLQVSGAATGTGLIVATNSSTLQAIQRDSSTRRIKQNIQPVSLEDAETALAITPVEYEMVADGTPDVGFIAEDFEAAGLTKFLAWDESGRVAGFKNFGRGIMAYQHRLIQDLYERVRLLEVGASS